jgi:Ca2+-binding RTX toxin-like protein
VFLTGSDQITGGAGNDTLMGGGGADTFIFHTDAGDDVIGDFATAEVTFTSGAGYQVSTLSADFETGIDQIQLMAFGTVNASNVMSAISDTAQGARFDAEGTRILFHGISSSQLSADDFIFA